MAANLSLGAQRPCREQRRNQGRPDRLRRPRQRGGGELPGQLRERQARGRGRRLREQRQGRRPSRSASSSPTKVDVPDDRVFSGFDAYQKAIDCGRRHGDHGHAARLPPDPLRGGHRGRQARLHGEAVLRRRAGLSARCWRRTSWPTRRTSRSASACSAITRPPTSRRSSGSTTARSATSSSSASTGTAPACGTARRQPEARPKWNTRCATGTTSSGSAAITSASSTSTTSTSATGSRTRHPVEANGMGGRQVRKFGPDGDFGQIYDHHAVEFTYRRRHEDVQPVPPYPQLLRQRVGARPRHEGLLELRRRRSPAPTSTASAAKRAIPTIRNTST